MLGSLWGIGNGQSEENAKDVPPPEEAPVKYCPIMTSGNVSASQLNQVQTRVRCMGKACGIWDETYEECGLITNRQMTT